MKAELGDLGTRIIAIAYKPDRWLFIKLVKNETRTLSYNTYKN